MATHLLFVCARGSSRALLAASLLHAQRHIKWEVWATPPQDEQDAILARQILYEQGLAPLPTERLILPLFGMHWDEGIILCSGTTDT
ncbi:MAG: hypothetical protein ACRDHZ_05800 [Ktedonobacteraceae bacterium]